MKEKKQPEQAFQQPQDQDAFLAFLDQGIASEFTFEIHPGLKGLKVPTCRVDLPMLVARHMGLLNRLLPQLGGALEKIKSGDQKDIVAALGGIDSKVTDQFARAAIDLVGHGCPWLSGRLHATIGEVPKGESGAPLRGHFYYGHLGADFWRLFGKICDDSGIGEVRAQAALPFLEQLKTALKS